MQTLLRGADPAPRVKRLGVGEDGGVGVNEVGGCAAWGLGFPVVLGNGMVELLGRGAYSSRDNPVLVLQHPIRRDARMSCKSSH